LRRAKDLPNCIWLTWRPTPSEELLKCIRDRQPSKKGDRQN
jgi:hypothetical protein